MSRRETAFLLAALALVAVGFAIHPTTPHGKIPIPHRADWSAIADDPGRVLEISWAGPPATPSAKEGTWIERRIEERFHVDLKPVFLDWNSYNNRRPLMFSGGEVPDVCWDGDPLPLRRSIQHGLVLEVPYAVILEHAPTYVRLLNRYGFEAWLYARYQGRNFGIPTWSSSGRFTHSAVWRMDYLKTAGIAKVPETIAEMHDAFARLRKAKVGPGGRGVYGMCPTLHWSMTFADLFAPHALLPWDFMRRDGQIVWGGAQPEAKQVLAILRQWYSEGLIDPDFSSSSAGTDLAEERFLSGKSAYLYQYKRWADLDLENPNSFYSKLRQLDPRAELALAPPLRGPDGKRRDRVWGGAGHVIWFGRQVANEPGKVLRVLRMFEAFATDRELFVESRLGRRGEHWEFSSKRGVYLLPPYDQPGADLRNLIDLRSLLGCFGVFSCSSAPPEFTDALLPSGTPESDLLYSNPEWGIMNPLGKSDVVDSASEVLQDLRQFQMTAFIEFVRGDRPLGEFDAFVVEWRRRGGDRITLEANAIYRDKQRIAALVGATTDGSVR